MHNAVSYQSRTERRMGHLSASEKRRRPLLLLNSDESDRDSLVTRARFTRGDLIEAYKYSNKLLDQPVPILKEDPSTRTSPGAITRNYVMVEIGHQ
jgi:hypothetical protein